MPEHPLIESLNSEQKEAVLQCEGPCLVIAGPGSGKTRALTHKIAYLISEKGIHPDQILAVTFTNKAAKEMKERVVSILSGELSVNNSYGGSIVPSWIGTFHSTSARILRMEATKIGLNRNFVIYDTDDSTKLIKEIMTELDFNQKELQPSQVLHTISKAKSELVKPDRFAAEAFGYYFERVAKIYPKYQEKLKENNALDFNDLLSEVVFMFENYPEILEEYQNYFKYILIDEYQDTNKVQYEIVRMLASKHRNITVVGDVSQSIYSWRGADYKNMLLFQNDYPDAKLIKLGRNYRSTEIIVKAAQSVIENNATHMPIDLYTDKTEGANILLFEAQNEKHEARFIIDSIISEIKSIVWSDNSTKRYSDFAILYRTNAQSRALEEEFVRQGVPYRIIGGIKFYDRREIKDVMSYLRVFYNARDSVSWARCINTPPRKIGPKAFQKIVDSNFDLDLINNLTKLDWKSYVDWAQGNSSVILGSEATPESDSGQARMTSNQGKQASVIELLDAILKDFGYLEYLNDGSEDSVYRIENIKELRTVAKSFSSLSDFLENVALVESSSRALEDNEAVTLMTIHAAKGLEFDTVFIVGMEEGVFPHSRSMTDPSELEEERRLCYVAITRAKNNLYLTYTRSRTYFGQTESHIISRFISEIPEELITFRFS